MMNRLRNEKSAYLKHAADQKIGWYPWSEEAFEKSRQEGKPVFLSSGAVWCHWCHVMAKECFYDDDIAVFLNENFIVKSPETRYWFPFLCIISLLLNAI